MTEKSVAVVTGGNRGMGLATCRALAEKGFQVIMTSRDLDAGYAAAGAMSDRGLSVEAVKLDVTSQSDIERLAEYISDMHGRIDVLVNNAGILIDGDLENPASICKADAEIIRKSFDVNTVAPIMLIKALLPLMWKAGYGRIINISSGMGQLNGMGGQHPGYRISKAALNAVTAIFAAELKGSGIAINAVSPGWVRTEMGGSNAERSLEQGIDTAVWLATEADIEESGGFYQDRHQIDW